MSITEKLRGIYIILGYTPNEISRATGISIYKAKKLYNSDYVLKADDLLALCKHINLEPNKLIRGGVSQ